MPEPRLQEPPPPAQTSRHRLLGALIAAVVTLVVALSGHFLLQAGLLRSAPSLEEATRIGAAAVGQSVSGQFARALDLGIPLERLQNVEAYLLRIVDSSPQVTGLALLDADGETIAATSATIEGEAFPIGRAGARLVVAAGSPLIEAATTRIRVALGVASLLTGIVAGLVMAGFVSFHQNPARERLSSAMSRVMRGDFAGDLPDEARGRFFEAEQALARLVERATNARRRLTGAVATIRAIDFDGSLGRHVEAIVRPIEQRYTFSERAEDEAESRSLASPGGTLWRAAAVCGFYAAAFPFVANFALDRGSDLLPQAWEPAVPLLAELAAAVLGGLAGGTRAGGTRTSLALAVALLGVSLAATYWCRSYEFFVLLRAGAGFGAGLALAGLLRRPALSTRAIALVLAFSALVAAPLFAGLLAEALGRRAAFLALGIGALALAPLVAALRSPTGAEPDALPRPAVSNTASVLAVLPAAALVLIVVPAGIGYDNYLPGAGATAVLGLAALAAPRLPRLVVALALAAAAALIGLPPTDAVTSTYLGAAALGVALGGAAKSGGLPGWGMPAAAVAAALIGAAAAEHFAAIVAGAAIVLAGTSLIGRRRRQEHPA